MRFRYFIIALVIFAPTVNAEQTLKEIMTPPADSSDKENLRIWVPVERTSTCRMTINILNSKSDVIRHLVDALIPTGYHNFYWDKKTDSGEYVRAGAYGYLIDDCGKQDSGEVLVAYGPDEIVVDLVSLYSSPLIKSQADSMHLQVKLFNAADSLVAVTLDTTLGPGTHYIDLSKSLSIPDGTYREIFFVDGEGFIKGRTFNHKK